VSSLRFRIDRVKDRLHAGGENYNYFWKARPL
jgi:hypothetical protein